MIGNDFTRSPDSGAISATLDANGDIVIDRYTATDNIDLNWELVEFPPGLLNVQHGTITQADGVSSSTATITDVGILADSFAIGTVTTPFGFGG